jgi:ABC-2 type transport system permease protein
MSTIAAPTPRSRSLLGGPVRFVRDTALLTGRSLRAIPRVPERLLDVTIQPVIFILLFLYVFGSAIHVRVIDRFRSMPINRLSIITGQVMGQSCEQLLGLVITFGVGLALGWDPHVTLAGGFELAALMLLGIFAFTWCGVLFGMLVRSPDAVQGVGFIVILPLTFMAGTFVQISGMDAVPRAIAEWDPISALVASVRSLTTPGFHSGGSWQLDHPELAMIGWCVILLAICVPLALRRFNRIVAG